MTSLIVYKNHNIQVVLHAFYTIRTLWHLKNLPNLWLKIYRVNVSLNRKEVTFIGINCKYSESHVLTCCHSYLALMGKNQHTYMFIFNNSVITYQRCVLLYFKPLWTEQFLSSSSSFLLHFNWFLKQYDI